MLLKILAEMQFSLVQKGALTINKPGGRCLRTKEIFTLGILLEMHGHVLEWNDHKKVVGEFQTVIFPEYQTCPVFKIKMVPSFNL